MTAFQWAADLDQTFDDSYDTQSLKGDYFDKDKGKSFILNTSKSLTLSSTTLDTEHNLSKGLFSLQCGTLDIGSMGAPVNRYTFDGESGYNIIDSKANLNINAKDLVIGAEFGVSSSGTCNLYGESNTLIYCNNLYTYSAYFYLSENANMEISFSTWYFDRATEFFLKDKSVLKISFDSFHDSSNISFFNLGGSTDNEQDETSRVILSPATPGGRNPFYNPAYSFEKGMFNFVTKDNNGNKIENYGQFEFESVSVLTYLQILDNGLIAIDGMIQDSGSAAIDIRPVGNRCIVKLSSPQL